MAKEDSADAASTDAVAVDQVSSDVPADVGPAKGGTAEIQLLSVSDWHGQLDPISESVKDGTQLFGGVGVLMTYFKADRAAKPHTFFLTGGDAFGATPALSNFFNDKPAVEALNLLGLFADTFGNHNFDAGVAKLKDLIALANYKYVSSNLVGLDGELPKMVTTPYLMFPVGVGANTVQVAVLGITNPDAPSLLFPGKMGKIQVQEPIAAANAAAKSARDGGAHVVIALVHMGATGKDDKDQPTGPLMDFVKGIKGIDVVLGDHTGQVVNGEFGGTLVVENKSKGRTYSRVLLQVTDGVVTKKSATTVEPAGLFTFNLGKDAGGATNKCPAVACPADKGLTCVEGKCVKELAKADPAAETLLKPYRDKLALVYDDKVAKVSELMIRDGVIERKQEVPIGNLIADALLSYYKDAGAQIAFTNSGGIRDSMPSSYKPKATGLVRTGCSKDTPCDLVIGDVFSVLPFGNTCVVRKITGEQLWLTLEHSVAKTPASDGRFLQIGGFKFSYSAKSAVGSRVKSVTLLADGKEIPNSKDFMLTMVTNDFTNAGGDSFTMLIEKAPSPALEVMADVVLSYLKKQGTFAPPKVERITVVE